MSGSFGRNCNARVSKELENFHLEQGECLNRESCIRVCDRFFQQDIRLLERLSIEDREEILESAKKRYEKLLPEHDSKADPITIEIRSGPVSMYGNVLKHYYARVENLLDVHPGTRHTLALSWWHNTTALDTDVHERFLMVCGGCCDEILDHVWKGNENFNIIWSNCDILLNRCEQTFIVTVFVLNIVWYPLFHDYLGLVFLVVCLVVFMVLRYKENVYWYKDKPSDLIRYCPHVIVDA